MVEIRWEEAGMRWSGRWRSCGLAAVAAAMLLASAAAGSPGAEAEHFAGRRDGQSRGQSNQPVIAQPVFTQPIFAQPIFAQPVFAQSVVSRMGHSADQARGRADRPLIAAHRGASAHAPENTMAAFRLAEAMNADYIEVDVRATRDGVLIALHDETVDRTTNGKGRAGRMTFRDIRRLDAGGWFAPAYTGERIPSLDEVLDRFGGNIGLILELKQPAAYPGIEQALARALTERGLDRPDSGQIIIQSFDTRALRKVRELLPDVPLAVLVRRPYRLTPRILLEYSRFAEAVHLPQHIVRPHLIARIRSFGLSVMAWNAHAKRHVRRLEKSGVDGILTDDPLLY